MVSIFWLNGEKEILKGNNISDALSMAGYGNSDTVDIDFYAIGDKIDKYDWNEKRRAWINLHYQRKKFNTKEK